MSKSLNNSVLPNQELPGMPRVGAGVVKGREGMLASPRWKITLIPRLVVEPNNSA